MSATDASRRTRVFKGQIEAVSHQWVRQFAHLDADRRRTHRCIETLLDMEDPDAHKAALAGLYGYEILNRATAARSTATCGSSAGNPPVRTSKGAQCTSVC